MNKCTHIVMWTSSVTNNKRSSGVGSLKDAKKMVKDLIAEGAKDVSFTEFKPFKIY